MLRSSAQTVSQPVHRLDAPLAAGDAGQVRGPGALRVQAGDGVHDLLADRGAGEVVAVAADPCGLGGVRGSPGRRRR